MCEELSPQIGFFIAVVNQPKKYLIQVLLENLQIAENGQNWFSMIQYSLTRHQNEISMVSQPDHGPFRIRHQEEGVP